MLFDYKYTSTGELTIRQHLDMEMCTGEKMEVLYDGPFTMKTRAWFTKEQVLNVFRKSSTKYPIPIVRMHKILWDGKSAWSRDDVVLREQTVFDMNNPRNLDDMFGYLFRASINGYTIRYAIIDLYPEIYLERSRDSSTNIDEDVIDAIVDKICNR